MKGTVSMNPKRPAWSIQRSHAAHLTAALSMVWHKDKRQHTQAAYLQSRKLKEVLHLSTPKTEKNPNGVIVF